MNLLLDECTPKRLKRDFTGHQVFTVDDVGLKGVKNGALLRAAAEQFDVFDHSRSAYVFPAKSCSSELGTGDFDCETEPIS